MEFHGLSSQKDFDLVFWIGLVAMLPETKWICFTSVLCPQYFTLSWYNRHLFCLLSGCSPEVCLVLLHIYPRCFCDFSRNSKKGMHIINSTVSTLIFITTLLLSSIHFHILTTGICRHRLNYVRCISFSNF